MKHIRKFAALVIVSLLAVSAFAKDKNTVDLVLSQKASVSGTTLEPGSYKVTLDRNGDNVDATFVSKGKTIAKTTGRFESRPSLSSGVAVMYNAQDRAIQQLLVKRINGAVVFDSTAASSAAGH